MCHKPLALCQILVKTNENLFEYIGETCQLGPGAIYVMYVVPEKILDAD